MAGPLPGHSSCSFFCMCGGNAVQPPDSTRDLLSHDNDRPDSPRAATLQRRAAFRNLLTGWPLGISSSCLSSDARTQGGSSGDISLFCSPPRDIEIFALFISCMCHDLDHRGTNNSFQVASVRACPPHSGDPLPCPSQRRDGSRTSSWGEREAIPSVGGAHSDPDRRGNQSFYGLFQKSVLAALYSSEGSVMEVNCHPAQLLF